MWLTFIGFMGSGKSTAAASMATRLGRPFVDLDETVERIASSSVSEIFQTEGEAGFRSRELSALAQLPRDKDLIVATGGGVVETPAAVVLLQERGPILWLDLDWKTVWQRLANSAASRPLVAYLGEAGLAELFARRRSLYRKATSNILRSDQLTLGQTVEAAIGFLNQKDPGE